jgi:enamine deaminase RidA (YjgF/YER057c/UK114 family)
MSQAVIHNHTVYLAGQVASGAPGGSVAEQTKDILSKIDALLAEAETDESKILSATIWLTDMSTFSEMNGVWEAWSCRLLPRREQRLQVPTWHPRTLTLRSRSLLHSREILGYSNKCGRR